MSYKDAKMLLRGLLDSTRDLSGHEAKRDYIGLSSIGMCPRKVLDDYYNGKAGDGLHTLFYLCRQIEASVIDRLCLIGDFRPAEPIVLYDGLVRGHPDGIFNGRLVEIKTVPLQKYIPDKKLSRKIMAQVQAYMHYSRIGTTFVIYVARDSGFIKVFEIRYDPRLAASIERQVHEVVRYALDDIRPACVCGRCGR